MLGLELISLLTPFFISSSSVYCPKTGPSLQAQEPRLQFCRRQVFHRKLRNRGCNFTRDFISAVASRCFPHPFLFSIWTELKRSEINSGAPTWRWGEWIWLIGPSGLHWKSPQGLNEEQRSRKVHVHKSVRPNTQTLNSKKEGENLSFHYKVAKDCSTRKYTCTNIF